MYVAAAAAQQPFAVVKNICQKYLYPYRTHTQTFSLSTLGVRQGAR